MEWLKHKNLGISIRPVILDGKNCYQVHMPHLGFFYVDSVSDITNELVSEQYEIQIDKLNEFVEIEKGIRKRYNEFSFNNPNISKIWFTADLHIGHTSILKHHKDRGFLPEEINEHDDEIIATWNNTVAKKDILYLVGDIFWFSGRDKVEKLMHGLNGNKHMIYGNHDATAKKIPNFFKSVSDIKKVVFKAKLYSFLDEDFSVVMSHYPMLSWEGKTNNAVMVHGHVHGKMDDVNNASTDFRFDVGWDSELGFHRFVPLVDLYIEYRKKQFLTNNIKINL